MQINPLYQACQTHLAWRTKLSIICKTASNDSSDSTDLRAHQIFFSNAKMKFFPNFGLL